MIGFALSVLGFVIVVGTAAVRRCGGAAVRQPARSLSDSLNNKTRGPFGPAGFASSQRRRAHASQVIEW
jgi:hypothetical protein